MCTPRGLNLGKFVKDIQCFFFLFLTSFLFLNEKKIWKGCFAVIIVPVTLINY